VEPVFEPVARCGVAYMSRSRLEARGVASQEAGEIAETSGDPVPSSPRRRGSGDVDSGERATPVRKAKARTLDSRHRGNDEQQPGETRPKRNNTHNSARKTNEPA